LKLGGPNGDHMVRSGPLRFRLSSVTVRTFVHGRVFYLEP